MSHGSKWYDHYVEALEEFGLALFILALHGLLAIAAILIGAGVHKVLDAFTSENHAPEIAGVSARYIIEGGEIMLIAVVLFMGVISALATFVIRLLRHLKG